MRYIKPLEEADIITLEEAVKNSTIPKFRNRCQSLLLSNKGFKVKVLAEMYEVRTRTIYTWFNRYESIGIIGLFFLSGNRNKSVLSTDNEEHVEIVKEVLKKKARHLKLAASKIGEKLGLNISNGQLKRFIKKLGYTWKRFRKSLKSQQDKIIYNAKLKQLKELYTLEEQGYLDIYYADESGFNLTPYIPYGWQPKGEYIELLPKKSKRLNVFGFINKENDLTSFVTTQSINSYLVIACIDSFVETIRKKTVVIIDNASIHHSDNFEDKIREWKEEDLYVFYLPTYSPHLNLIEILWRKIKYEWLEPEHYENWMVFQDAVENILSKVGGEFKINFREDSIFTNKYKPPKVSIANE
jgi:transposase